MPNFYCLRRWLGLSLALLLAACASPGQQPPGAAPADDTLFSLQPAQSRQALAQTPGANAYLQTLLQSPASADIRLVDVKALRIAANTQTLSIPLPGGSTARFKLMRIDQSMPGMTGWIGDIPSDRKQRFTSPAEVDMDPFNWVSLLREGDKVVGSIHVAGQAYRLEPIGAGRHVLVKVDESRLPSLDKDAAADEPSPRKPSTGRAPASPHSTIRVLVVSNDHSRVSFPDYRLQMAQGLQLANQFMINSRVDVTYELAGYYDASYDPTGRDKDQQLRDLRYPDRALGKAVYAQRDAVGADLVVMVSWDFEGCGYAYVSSVKATGYSILECFGGVLAHELGHNLGTTHEYKEDDPRGPPYMYGYGRTQAPVLHTVMRTSHGAIPYFSNPRLQYQGVPIGTVEREDVARRFNEYREGVENFYPQPSGMQLTLYEDEHFKGRSCNAVLHGNAGVILANLCGAEWSRLVSSVRVQGITPGTRLYFSAPRNQGTESYTSTTYRGDLEIPTFASRDPLPYGITRARSGESVNDKVDLVSTFGGE
ncbi:zinc-dependent metalloprotease family protein [Pseudomonas xanthosomatis]|uniref:zinc-dependent metalloprotease family protein n=1 Tax=Pseudomonas xanthosomatis TaxID=2842356 RepID=UPI00351219EE